MDAFVRRYIHENLNYRFTMLPDGAAAYTLEAAIKSGGWGHGRPLLIPEGDSRERNGCRASRARGNRRGRRV